MATAQQGIPVADLNSFFGSADSALNTVEATSTQSVSGFDRLRKSAAEVGDAATATNEAVTAHNVQVSQTLADITASTKAENATATVALEQKMLGANELLDSTRNIITANSLQAVKKSEELATLRTNRPSLLLNPLGAITSAYKASRLDQEIFAHRTAAEEATVNANRIVQALGADMQEEHGAAMMRISAEYEANRSAAQARFAGEGAQLAGAQERVKILSGQQATQTDLQQRGVSTGQDAQRIGLAKRAQGSADEEKRQLESLAGFYVDYHKLPANQQNLDRALIAVKSMSPEARRVLADTALRTDDANRNGIKLNALQQYSVGGINEAGEVLRDPKLQAFGSGIYTQKLQQYEAQLVKSRYEAAMPPGKNGKPASSQAAWEAHNLKPTDRAKILETAKALAKEDVRNTSVADLNRGLYERVDANAPLQLGAANRNPALFKSVYGVDFNSAEGKLLRDPKTQVALDAVAAQRPDSKGYRQLSQLVKVLDAAGVKDPYSIVSKVAAAQARGYAFSAPDGQVLLEAGYDLPAYYNVKDSSGRTRNLANPEELKKLTQVEVRAAQQSRELRARYEALPADQKSRVANAQGFETGSQEPSTVLGFFGLESLGSAADAVTATIAKQQEQTAEFLAAAKKVGGGSTVATGAQAAREPALEERVAALESKRTAPATRADGGATAPGSSRQHAQAAGSGGRTPAEVQQVQEEFQEVQAAQSAEKAQPERSALRDFVRGDPEERESYLAAKGGASSTSSVPLADFVGSVESRLQAVESAKASPQEKQDTLMQIVRDMFKRAFGGGIERGFTGPTEEQRLEAAKEYERTQR